jgi:hypothetical protein
MAGKARSGQADNSPQRMSSDIVGTALIDGATFSNKAVQYAEVNGLAVFEGDIVLGRVEEVAARTEQRRAAGPARGGLIAHGVVITGAQYRWPGGVVPYEIDSAMPDQGRVTDAIAHWHQHTAVRLVPRAEATVAHSNYVRFFAGDGCWSYVGMQDTGKQDISLSAGCGLAAAIHEIGHAVGLWHEQSREDRDSFVTIHWANIQAGKEHNFNQHIADGDDVGAYDYASIMHYPRTAFSKNGQDTIVPTDPNAPATGQSQSLSPGDIAAVASMYGQPVKHVWTDPQPHLKKVLDDPLVSVKKLRDDPIQPLKKVRDDPVIGHKKLRDDVLVRPLRPIPGPFRLGDRGLSPFLLSTPHHAPPGDGAGQLNEAELEAVLGELAGQLAARAAAVETAERNVVALQTALTSAAADLATAQEAYAGVAEQVQALGAG